VFRGLSALAAAAVLAALAAGCGGNDGTPGATDTQRRSPASTTVATDAAPTVPPPAATNGATTVATGPSIPPPRTAPPAGAEGGSFVVGAVDDAARHGGPMLDQLVAAGFGALGITSYWEPGRSRPTADELRVLRDTATRAHARGLRVFVAVFHRGSSTTPLTPAARGQFASYVAALVRGVPLVRDVIIGNEPNLNRFWLPQFAADGSNAASPAYYALLAQTFAAVKAADPGVLVWGGALAPRGNDRPQGIRHTQSPAAFIRGLGEAFRASGRRRPPLDGFAFHPYPESAAIPPDLPHEDPRSKAIGMADLDRLQGELREAFGRELPILYSELGVETAIPTEKRRHYTGEEVVDPVDEATQAEFYRRALKLAACQPDVVGLLLFHSHDEPALVGFQSGVYYVDGTPKTSLPAVREAILAARDGC
jgi:hypothetical protein